MAGKYNINADQGSTFSFQFTMKTNGTAWNLTGYTARMQVRTDASSTTVLISATTTNGYIVLGGAAGTVTVTIPATVMETVAAGKNVYDIELVNGTTVYRVLEGKFNVKQEVTR